MALEDIEHIVVLVMENRSFDHLLGYRFPETHPKGEIYRKGRISPGPKHTYSAVQRQLDIAFVDGKEKARMDGFDADYARIWGSNGEPRASYRYDRELVPVYDFLANHYLLCDRWFSSVPGPTLPNRSFLFAGHSAGIVDNAEMALHALLRGVCTIFDHLGESPGNWCCYYHDVPSIRFIRQFTRKKGITRKFCHFKDDAASGRLAKVSWIDPNFSIQSLPEIDGHHLGEARSNDDHPPADIRRGQALVAEVYNALIVNRDAWKKTLLLITYDEHGGFADSVEPPVVPARAPAQNAELFQRFGVRVPTFVISPWVRHRVCSDELEHTSIPRTILERFAPEAVESMGERLQGAPSLASLLEDTLRADASDPPRFVADPEQPAAPLQKLLRDAATEEATTGPIYDEASASDFHGLAAGLAAHLADEDNDNNGDTP